MLPLDYGYWGTVRHCHDKWAADGTWVRINDFVRERAGQAAGRNAQPSAAVLDGQSVKISHVGGERGFDAAKRVTGRQRHLLARTLGFLPRALVTPADASEGAGGMRPLLGLNLLFTGPCLPWVDQGCKEGFVAWVAEHVGWTAVGVTSGSCPKPDRRRATRLAPRRRVACSRRSCMLVRRPPDWYLDHDLPLSSMAGWRQP